MADATAASLATALLGLNRKRDPLDIYNSFAKQQLAAGTSTAPLGSGNPIEGVARALQGGIGGLTAGIMAGREEAKGKDTVAFLADLLNSKDNTELATKAQGFKGDPEVLAPILSQLVGNRQQQFQRDAAGNQFVAGYGGGGAPSQAAAPPGGLPQPGYGASSAPGSTGQQTLSALESGNNPRAVNPQSGAGGLYQFLPDTWAQVRKDNPQLNLPETVGQASEPQQHAAEQAFRTQNATALQAAGIQPTPGNLYLAHRAGPQGAQTILQASPDTPLSTIVPPIWLQQNPDMRTTAGQFVAQANQRFPSSGAPAQAGPVGPGQIAAPPTQIAQGDTQPPAAPSSASEPPVIPKPAPTPEQLQRYKGLVTGGESAADANAKLQAEIQHQWDRDQTRATQIWQDQQTSKRQNEKAAIDLGQKAPMEMIAKRVDNYENKIRPGAQAAANSIDTIHQVRQVLDAGAFTGTGAGAKQFVAKIGEQLGIPSEIGINTQVLGSVLAKQVLAGAGGTLGTGFSNADRDFMEKAQGGQITLDEAALRRISDIGERTARQTLKNHDAEAARVKKLPGIGQLGDDQFTVNAPPSYQEWSKANPLPQAQGAVPAQTDIPTVQTPDEARKLPKGTQFKTPDGRVLTVP